MATTQESKFSLQIKQTQLTAKILGLIEAKEAVFATNIPILNMMAAIEAIEAKQKAACDELYQVENQLKEAKA